MVLRLSSFVILTLFVILLLSPFESSSSSNSLISVASADASAVEIEDAAPDGQCDPKAKNCKSDKSVNVEENEEENEEDGDDDELDVADDEEESDEDDEDAKNDPEDLKNPDALAIIDPEGKEDDDSYTVPKATGALFAETFSSKDLKQWVVTQDDSYNGEFKVGQGKDPSIPGDRALIIPQRARKYGISAKVNGLKKMNNAKVVIQYEVKYEDGQTCGGAYLKLPLQGFDQKKFNGDTPYSIMFGPDKCGATNKVHFIFQSEHKGKKREHHLSLPPAVPIVGDVPETQLYTLIIDNKESSYEILINGDSKSNGTFEKSFEPAVQLPEKIDDPEDKKPKDWIDEKKIADENAVKPDDWDEDAPKQIIDENATKPEDWDEDAELKITDPEAKKPEDWDDSEDGTWEAPLIDNPKCAEISGCGPWKKPMIANPDYKGKWKAPMIDNPKYVGPWKAKQIANPDYYKVDKIEILPIGGVALELWTMDQGVLFDNIYIGNDADKAKAFADATWGKKVEAEKVKIDKKTEEQKKEAAEEGDEDPDADDDEDDEEDDGEGEEEMEEDTGDEDGEGGDGESGDKDEL